MTKGSFFRWLLLFLALGTLLSALACRSSAPASQEPAGSTLDDADPPAARAAIVGAARPGLRRWVVPEPSQTLAVTGRDGVYQKPGPGRTVADLRIELTDGATNPARAGIIYDVDQFYADASIHDVVVRPTAAVNWTLWGVRRYGLENARTERVLVRNIGREHGFYESAWGGVCEWIDCTAINCAAQGFQLRLTGNRGDPHWADERLIVLTRFTALECGQARGAGRAGFSVSIKDQGPATDVLLDDLLVRTVAQHQVAKRTDGTWADSFGGVCVEFCRSLEIRGGYVEMRNGQRDAIQLFDFANNAPTRTGPDRILVDGLTLVGGALSIRVGDGSSVVVRNCVALEGARIKLYARGADGVWRISRSVPLEDGWGG